jgi:hypothetical protein
MNFSLPTASVFEERETQLDPLFLLLFGEQMDAGTKKEGKKSSFARFNRLSNLADFSLQFFRLKHQLLSGMKAFQLT